MRTPEHATEKLLWRTPQLLLGPVTHVGSDFSSLFEFEESGHAHYFDHAIPKIQSRLTSRNRCHHRTENGCLTLVGVGESDDRRSHIVSYERESGGSFALDCGIKRRVVECCGMSWIDAGRSEKFACVEFERLVVMDSTRHLPIQVLESGVPFGRPNRLGHPEKIVGELQCLVVAFVLDLQRDRAVVNI